MRMLAFPRLSGALLGLILAISGSVGCDRQDPVSRGRINAFDTTLDVTLIGVGRQRAAEITHVLEADMQLMEKSWHAWQPGPVSRMNQLFNEGSPPFAAPPSVLPLLRLSKALSEQSEGLFNPALGHLTRAWGFQGRDADCMRPPAQDLIDQVVKDHPSMRDITIDGFRVSASKPTVKLDFRAIQKGFAVDQAIARLQDLGINNASISVDGNVRAIGSRDGHPWSVPLRGPAGGGILATVQVQGNEAAFTAGDYPRNFNWDGKTYHDIIDPRTGYPATETASVTVLHPNASTADAAANALFVAGPKDWHRIARKMGIHYVMLTDRQGRLHMNPEMQARVRLQGTQREVIISEPLS